MRTLKRINPYYLTFFEGEAGGGGGTGGSGNPPQSGSTPPPANNPPATGGDDPVAKAYEKLREAEKERDQLKAQVTQFEREKLPEADRAKQEAADAKARAEKAEAELAETKTRVKAEKVATQAGFRAPGVAVDLLMFRKVDLSTDAKITSALNDLAKEDPGMVGTPPPSGGPINPQNGQQPVGNSGFNAAIRSAAGRPAG
jgi:hypothetical protein